MADRVEELERLQRLREAGTLDEAEFEAEKARLLRGRRQAQLQQPRRAYGTA